MLALEPSRDRHSEVAALLHRVAAEDVVGFDPDAESGLARHTDAPRFAVVVDGQVRGYLSGIYSGWHPKEHADTGVPTAFIRLVVLDLDARGKGHGLEAVRVFALLARSARGAEMIGLVLDTKGNREKRQRSFEEMGFRFAADEGLMCVADVCGAPSEAG